MAATPAAIFRRNLGIVLSDRGMTMQELADLCETKRPNISRILGGTEQVTIERAGRIAKALGLELFEMLNPSMESQKKLQEIA